ncbi:MAG: TPM domain-containing protein [Rubricoccaceae bacterium]
MPETLFTDAERARIREAVAAAERRSAGEIVPLVVLRSGRYDLAVWRAAAAGALLAMALVLGGSLLHQGWGLAWLYTHWATAAAAVLGGTLGALVGAYVPAVQRALLGEAYLAEQVHRRAMQAFVEEEVFSTRDRTGILLFVSLQEHRIEVFGDAGINARVAPEEWVDVVARARERIRKGHLAEGLVDAIERCGELLERRGVPLRGDDAGELPDDVRVSQR